MVVPYHLEYYTTTYNDDVEFNNMLYVFKCTLKYIYTNQNYAHMRDVQYLKVSI